MKVLVSSCLLGDNCRYDGGNCLNQAVIEYLKDKQVIAVCPELLGGLNTPRLPCEVVNDKVYSVDDEDVTIAFTIGAYRALGLALQHECKLAILKSRSPSCGVGVIYDGTFSNVLMVGNGVAAELLAANGIIISSEEDYASID